MEVDKRRAIIDIVDKLSTHDTEAIFKLFVASGVTRDQCITHANGECSINLDLLSKEIINAIYTVANEKLSASRLNAT